MTNCVGRLVELFFARFRGADTESDKGACGHGKRRGEALSEAWQRHDVTPSRWAERLVTILPARRRKIRSGREEPVERRNGRDRHIFLSSGSKARPKPKTRKALCDECGKEWSRTLEGGNQAYAGEK
jgi:hypothetical protein